MAELGPYQEELRAVTCDDCPLRLLGEEAVSQMRSLAQCFMRAKRACKAPK